MSLLRRYVGGVLSRPWLRVAAQGSVSAALIALLVIFAKRHEALEKLRDVEPTALLAATAMFAVGIVINAFRWQLLLRNQGIREKLPYLTALYLVGLFFSVFLPTSAGGDAVRMVEVTRRSGRATAAIIATLQERLLNLGAGLLIGLAATLWFLPLVPDSLRMPIVFGQLGTALGITFLIYPGLPWAIGARLWRSQKHRSRLHGLVHHRIVARILAVLRPVAKAPPLAVRQLLPLLLIASTAVLLGIGMYYAVGRSLEIHASFLAYCLVVPLVWIVRMLPVSLNGAGVGEMAFVFLLRLFQVPDGQAAALAVAMLALQTCLALTGGLVLLARIVLSTRTKTSDKALSSCDAKPDTLGSDKSLAGQPSWDLES